MTEDTEFKMLSINHLPPEILEKIFKLFSYPDLSSCANVCRRWNSIIINSILPSFDIAKDSEVFGSSLLFFFVPNLTAICLLLKHDRDVFKLAQQFIQLQGKTLEKVILTSSTYVNHNQNEDRSRYVSYDKVDVDLIYELTNLPILTNLIINFPVPVFHEFNDKAYQLLHHLSLDISSSTQSYCHTCSGNIRMWCNLFKYSGASITWISNYPINYPQVEIDCSKLKIFSKVEFLSFRTNIFDQNYAEKLFILFPSITKLELHAWTDYYSELIKVCVQYEQLTHLKIRVWTCSGIKYKRYDLNRLLINDDAISAICIKLKNLTSLDLHGHLDLNDQSLEMMNQNINLVSIKITNGGIPFYEVNFDRVERKPSVQFSEDALINFVKNHSLEQLELYVGQMTILETFIDKLVVNCSRIKVLKLYSGDDTDPKINGFDRSCKTFIPLYSTSNNQ